jgi:hypothetical protein
MVREACPISLIKTAYFGLSTVRFTGEEIVRPCIVLLRLATRSFDFFVAVSEVWNLLLL